MAIQFFDTRKRQKLPFEPIDPGHVRMYNCGPTVHDFAHIGNFRAYVFADILRRWLEVRGFDVTQIMNITDVDDKTIRKSHEQKRSLEDYTKAYTAAFFEDLDRLNILRAHEYPRATGHVDEMVELIESLLEKDHAYRAEDGSIYFKVTSYPEYGLLSGKRLEDLRVGERVSNDEYESKDDVRDFALWKVWDEEDGDVYWETSLGKGRPGWHIECSAMSREYLGDEFDIHTGGVDNIFPHHENEIAQSRCATGAEFAHRWMHCEYLIVENKKMSKSLGNFFTLRDLIEQGYYAREIRYMLAGTHYRSRLNFTLDGLKGARKSLQRLDEFKASWEHYGDGEPSFEVGDAIDRAEATFQAAMDDDLNVSQALAAVFSLVRVVNSLASENLATSSDRAKLEGLWDKWDHALGLLTPLDDEIHSATDFDESWIKEKIEERRQARADKEWARADQVRDELAELGIQLKDGPEGTTWERVK